MFSILGNTTNLIFHIKHDHKQLVPGPDEPVRDKQNMVQPKIDLAVSRQHIPKERQAKLDDIVLKLVISKSLPLSLISNEIFKEFVSELDPRYY